MSNFTCEKCGTVILDGPNGYITGCEHYPIEKEKSNLFKQDLFNFFVQEHNLHLLDGEMNDIINFIHKNYPDEDLKNKNTELHEIVSVLTDSLSIGTIEEPTTEAAKEIGKILEEAQLKIKEVFEKMPKGVQK